MLKAQVPLLLLVDSADFHPIYAPMITIHDKDDRQRHSKFVGLYQH